MPVMFDVRLKQSAQGKKNLFLSHPKGPALGKMAMSQQVSPIHTRPMANLGKDYFDQSYLGQNSVAGNTSVDFKESGGSLMQTKKKVKEYIENINAQLTETKKQEISQIRDFRQYVKLIGNELQQ